MDLTFDGGLVEPKPQGTSSERQRSKRKSFVELCCLWIHSKLFLNFALLSPHSRFAKESADVQISVLHPQKFFLTLHFSGSFMPDEPFVRCC